MIYFARNKSMLKQCGNLFVISAPSGAGKTSLVKALVNQVSNIYTSISYTTRPPRRLEVHGKDYFFVDDVTFTKMLANDDFIESAEVYGYYYGTPRAWVEQQLADGMDVILEIDWQGAQKIRQQFEGAVLIFILPPSLEILRQRLRRRDQDTDDVIETRLNQALDDISHSVEFDHKLLNNQFYYCVKQLKNIVLFARLC